MALMYPFTTLVPTKLELLATWLPGQPWFSGDVEKLERIGEYRLDDPDGEVGLNGLIFSAGDTVYHVPLSYRDAPLEEAEGFLVGTMEHGVLGTRWAYAGMGDPVYRAVLAQTIAQGLTGAIEHTEAADGTRGTREIAVPLQGSGDAGASVPEVWAAEVAITDAATVASTGLVKLSVIHAPATETGKAAARGASGTLSASWPGQDEPLVIATLD